MLAIVCTLLCKSSPFSNIKIVNGIFMKRCIKYFSMMCNKQETLCNSCLLYNLQTLIDIFTKVGTICENGHAVYVHIIIRTITPSKFRWGDRESWVRVEIWVGRWGMGWEFDIFFFQKPTSSLHMDFWYAMSSCGFLEVFSNIKE